MHAIDDPQPHSQDLIQSSDHIRPRGSRWVSRSWVKRCCVEEWDQISQLSAPWHQATSIWITWKWRRGRIGLTGSVSSSMPNPAMCSPSHWVGWWSSPLGSVERASRCVRPWGWSQSCCCPDQGLLHRPSRHFWTFQGAAGGFPPTRYGRSARSRGIHALCHPSKDEQDAALSVYECSGQSQASSYQSMRAAANHRPPLFSLWEQPPITGLLSSVYEISRQSQASAHQSMRAAANHRPPLIILWEQPPITDLLSQVVRSLMVIFYCLLLPTSSESSMH